MKTLSPHSAREAWTFDRWVQRVTLAALILLALFLVGFGVALYAPRSSRTPAPTASELMFALPSE